MLYWMPWMRCMRCGYWLFGLRCVRNIGDKLCCQSKFIEWFELNLVAKQSMIKWSQSVKDICSFVLCTQCMWINSMWIDGRTKKCSFPPNILLVTFNRRKSYLRSCHDTLCADQTQTMGVHCRPLFFPHNRRKKNIYRHLASHNQPKKKGVSFVNYYCSTRSAIVWLALIVRFTRSSSHTLTDTDTDDEQQFIRGLHKNNDRLKSLKLWPVTFCARTNN